MLKRNHCFLSLALSVLSLSLGAETLPSYVVTANRESEDAMAVPAQVSVVTSDEIAASGKTSIVEVLEDIAGVSFKSYSTDAEAQVSMRGFGENSFGRVQVLVDGRSLNNPDMKGLNWQSIPLSSIERIEVLDGPAGVAYGSGAVGGVINVITKESAEGVTAEATLSYGSFNTRQALINAGLGSESAGFLVSADLYWTDGYRDNSANRSTNVTANGFVDLGDKLTLKPFLTCADIRYEMPGSLTQAQFGEDPARSLNDDDHGTDRNLGGGLAAVYSASSRLAVELPLDYARKDRVADMASWSSYTDVVQHQFGARPKISFDGDGARGTYRIAGGFDFSGALHDAAAYSDENRTVKSYGFDIAQFGYAPWLSTSVSLPRNLSLTAGARYDTASIEAEKGALDESDTYSALVYDISLGYRPLDAISFYAKYNTLFRYPFIDEKAELTGYPLDRFNSGLEPETGRNLEAGAKYRHGEILSVSGNVYWMVMEDEIAYATHNVNLDETTRIGGTAAVNVKPADFLSLDLDGSYVRAAFSAGDRDGDAVPLIPSLTVHAGADVSFPIGITVGTDVSYTGERSYDYQDAYGELHVDLDPYVLLGLSLKVAPAAFDDRLVFTVRADNLLDAQYASFVAYGYDAVYPAEGRSFTVSAAYRY